MSEDLDLLRRVVEEPVGQMLLAEVVSPTHSNEIARQIREWSESSRAVAEFGFNANRDDAAALWERCHAAVAGWDAENPGLLLVRDDSPADVRIAHGTAQKPTSIGFWRTMNQLREKWDALPSQTIFLVTHQQYFFLTTEADHFKRWIPLKLHLPSPEELTPHHSTTTPSRTSDEALTARLTLDNLEDEEVARQNWDTYQERLRRALERHESTKILAHRYYLPLMAAAITLKKWPEAANYNARISKVLLSPSQQLRWLRLHSRLKGAQGHVAEAIRIAEERLRLAEELEQEKLTTDKKKQQQPHNVLSALDDLFLLHKQQDNFDEAERRILQALTIAPSERIFLGNYANFLTDVRQDHDRAEEFYKRALDADPKHATNLGNYALFLTTVRQDYARAEEFYKRALDADPKHATNLGNYASLLHTVRQNHDNAEEFYKRALDADPKDARNLGNYANFLTDVRQDHDRAEEFYKRALDADPKHAGSLSGYAVFLCLTRHDFQEAATYFQRAVEAAPDAPQYAINYAALLLMQGQRDEGKAILERAAAMPDLLDEQQVGIAFHRYIHFPEEKPSPLKQLKQLIKAGKRATSWSFDLNIERAQQDGHPHLRLLKELAAVITEDKSLKTLNNFPQWQTA